MGLIYNPCQESTTILFQHVNNSKSKGDIPPCSDRHGILITIPVAIASKSGLSFGDEVLQRVIVLPFGALCAWHRNLSVIQIKIT